MLLIGTFPNRASAVKEFVKLFGEYYGIGVDVVDGVDTSFADADLLVSEAMTRTLKTWATEGHAPYMMWHTSLHYNFS